MTVAMTDVVDLDVVDEETAANVGTVKALWADRSGRHISSVDVSDGLMSSRVLNWRQVVAVGPDALVTSSSGGEPNDDEDTSVDGADEATSLSYIGANVLTSDGVLVGSVTDVHFEESSGAVTALMTTEGRVDGQRIRSLGSFAVVVDPDVE